MALGSATHPLKANERTAAKRVGDGLWIMDMAVRGVPTQAPFFMISPGLTSCVRRSRGPLFGPPADLRDSEDKIVMSKLYTPVTIGSVALLHRVVQAPLTRLRSEQPGDVPGERPR